RAARHRIAPIRGVATPAIAGGFGSRLWIGWFLDRVRRARRDPVFPGEFEKTRDQHAARGFGFLYVRAFDRRVESTRNFRGDGGGQRHLRRGRKGVRIGLSRNRILRYRLPNGDPHAGAQDTERGAESVPDRHALDHRFGWGYDGVSTRQEG